MQKGQVGYYGVDLCAGEEGHVSLRTTLVKVGGGLDLVVRRQVTLVYSTSSWPDVEKTCSSSERSPYNTTNITP